MSRLGLVLISLFLVTPAVAAPAAAPGFDASLSERVLAAALAFIEPRALDPVTLPELTVWGLRGLTALDPDLTTQSRDGVVRLSIPGRELFAAPLPAADSADQWARLAVTVAEAAWTVSPIVRQARTPGVIQSFLDELFNHLDPYSRYIPPAQAIEEATRQRGAAGAGLTLVRKGQVILVRAVVPEGPGANAGIRPGDIVMAVDGQPTRKADAPTVSSWIAGPEGTEVSIEVVTPSGRRRTVSLVRARVPPETVFSARSAALLVLRITVFADRTALRLAQAMTTALTVRHPPEGIVLDLRGNRGGLLAEAVGAADALLPAGVVAFTQGRDPAADRIWRSEPGELGENLPVVVMVDGRTASAAEVLAAALADRGRAVVVGSSTLGKGLVQTTDVLPDGGELFVTWSRVLAPLGWPIQGLGVLPQICTSRGRAALLGQLAALALGEQPMAGAIARARYARAPVPAAEVIAIRNVCPAAEGSEADLATARELVADPATYAAALLPPMRGQAGAAAR